MMKPEPKIHYLPPGRKTVLCGKNRNVKHTTSFKKVTCKNCLKKTDDLEPVSFSELLPTPTSPGSDWRFPLDREKLEYEMKQRKVKLYSYYLGELARKMVWYPFTEELEVFCENDRKRFKLSDIDAALEMYNRVND